LNTNCFPLDISNFQELLCMVKSTILVNSSRRNHVADQLTSVTVISSGVHRTRTPYCFALLANSAERRYQGNRMVFAVQLLKDTCCDGSLRTASTLCTAFQGVIQGRDTIHVHIFQRPLRLAGIKTRHTRGRQVCQILLPCVPC
jgi:hypothetical protein